MTEPIRLDHWETPLVLVKAPVAQHCLGCVFEEEKSSKCPKKNGETWCYEVDSLLAQDHIWIVDSPESMAKYVTWLIEGYTDDDDDTEDETDDDI